MDSSPATDTPVDTNMDTLSSPESPTYTIDATIKSLSPAEYGSISSPTTRAIQRLQENENDTHRLPFLSLSSPNFDPVKTLFYSIRNTFPATVSFLLSPPYNIDPNSILPPDDNSEYYHPEDEGKTPLHLAASLGEINIAKILLRHGADPITIREPKLNHTPLDIALCKGRKEIVELMLEEIFHPSTEAGKKRDLTESDVAQYSIRHAVFYAASSRNVEVVRLVLERGFPVDTRTDVKGRSALIVAAALGAVDVVRELVEWVPKKNQGKEEDGDDGGEDRHQEMTQVEAEEGVGTEGQGDVNWVEVGGEVEDKGDGGEDEEEDDGRANLYILTNDEETPLSLAMMNNQRGVVRELVRLGVDLDVAWTENNRTALSLVSEQDIDGMVKLLLDLGADPNIPDDKGWTALHFAIHNDRERNVQELLFRGTRTDLTATMEDGTEISALDMTKNSGSEEIKSLLALSLNDASKAFFMEAVEAGRLAEMQRLAPAFEEPNRIRNRSVGWAGSTPLIVAAQNGHLEVVKWLLEEHDYHIGCQDECGHTALWWAAWYGHVDIVSALVDAGEDTGLADTTGMTPLLVARQRGWPSIVEILGGSGVQEQTTDGAADQENAAEAEDTNKEADSIPWRCTTTDVPDMVTDWFDQEEALFVAVTYGRVTSASLTLQMETNVDCRNSSGETPLMVAARKGDVLMLELLLDFGEANMGLVNDLGQTALFEAASWGQHEAITTLLGHGADATAADHFGRTPLMAAAHFGHEKAARVLIELGVDINVTDHEGRTALNHTGAGGSVSVIELLLSKGVEVDKADKNGITPLMSASQNGRLRAVTVLLEQAAAHSFVSGTGKTALSLAAEQGHESVANALINRQADINHQCHKGQTPLMLACRGRHTTLVKILIENGARIDIKDSKGKTALAIAQDLQYDNIMRLLSRATSYQSQIDNNLRPYYQYHPLSTLTSTRLLELHPATHESDILSFTLFEVDLDKSPYYETLSYEWGEPTGSIPAICNGKYLVITPNLKQAMVRIRSSMDPTSPKTLWIDAVCINQFSLSERSHQVSLMKRIYYEARSTIFYLGQSNHLTPLAAKNIVLLSQQHDILFQEVPGWSPLGHHTLQVPDTIYLHKILPLWEEILSDPNSAPALSDLFGRSYFTRAWIVQELLLSQHGTVLLSNSNHSHSHNNTDIQIPWSQMRNALWALEFAARYRLIHQFPVSDPSFREILMTTRKFRSLKSLVAALNVFMDGRLTKWPILMGLESLGPFKATDPRDKVYASTGFMHRLPDNGTPSSPNPGAPDRDGGIKFTADYELSVQEVYTNAVRYALLCGEFGEGMWKGKLDNIGKYMRPYDKLRLEGLPTWVPDWSRPIWTTKPSTAFSVGHLLDGDVDIIIPSTTADSNTAGSGGGNGAKLLVNGMIIDRVVQVVPITRDTRVMDLFKLVALMLAFEHDGISLLDFYPTMTNISIEEDPVTNLEALWDAITPEDKTLHTPERKRDILGFLLSGFIEDEKMPLPLRESLEFTRRNVMESEDGDRIVDLGKDDLFLEEYDWMERQVWRGDLVITERGGFGITNGLEVAEQGMVVAVVGGADEVYLLRECPGPGQGGGHAPEDVGVDGKMVNGDSGDEEVGDEMQEVTREVGDGSGPTAGEKWYEFVDVVDMRHMRRHFGSLEEIEEGASARIERLEIR